MKKASIAVLIFTVLIVSACQPKPTEIMTVEVVSLNTEHQQQSYALGASMGHIIQSKITKQKRVGIEYDQNLLVKGFIASLQGQSQLSQNEIQAVTQNVDNLVRQKQVELKIQKGNENKAKGMEFLAKNANRTGVEVLESGLQYEVITQGHGSKPSASDTVKVNYRGTLLDGTEFDSSYARNKPATFPLNRVIKGWTEGVQLMSVGAKFRFYVPANLAYGARSTGKIPSHSTLIFEVELMEIINTD